MTYLLVFAAGLLVGVTVTVRAFAVQAAKRRGGMLEVPPFVSVTSNSGFELDRNVYPFQVPPGGQDAA